MIAPKAGEHVLLQGIEAKSNSERNCIRCGKLFGSDRHPWEEVKGCYFHLPSSAHLYSQNGKYRKVTVRISINHDDDFDKIDAESMTCWHKEMNELGDGLIIRDGIGCCYQLPYNYARPWNRCLLIAIRVIVTLENFRCTYFQLPSFLSCRLSL